MEDSPVNLIDITLLGDPALFKKINSQTQLFVRLFTEIGNTFPQEYLQEIHHGSMGVKVSKGNQLDSLPYQVLDIIRDFDPHSGLNLRLLNWWGKGIYCIILYGTDAALKYRNAIQALAEEYSLSQESSKWDYSKIIDNSTSGTFDINLHLANFKHCQIVKKLELMSNYNQLKLSLTNHILYLLDIHQQ